MKAKKNKFVKNQEGYINNLWNNSGHLNAYENKINDNSPDYGGYIKINERPYRISGWVKQKNGKKFLTLKIAECDKNGNFLNYENKNLFDSYDNF